MQIMGTNPGVAGKAARRGGKAVGGALEDWLPDLVWGWGPAVPDGAADVHMVGVLGWGELGPCGLTPPPHPPRASRPGPLSCSPRSSSQ